MLLTDDMISIFLLANQIKFTNYVMTSKEYLTNCQILLQYFELVFLCVN